MKDHNAQHNQADGHDQKQVYEPPRATFIPVQIEERVLGCLFSTLKYCGLTEM